MTRLVPSFLIAVILSAHAALAAPLRSDVARVCCPAACAARKDVHLWPRANEVLRSCEVAMGEKGSRHTVEEICSCVR